MMSPLPPILLRSRVTMLIRWRHSLHTTSQWIPKTFKWFATTHLLVKLTSSYVSNMMMQVDFQLQTSSPILSLFDSSQTDPLQNIFIASEHCTMTSRAILRQRQRSPSLSPSSPYFWPFLFHLNTLRSSNPFLSTSKPSPSLDCTRCSKLILWGQLPQPNLKRLCWLPRILTQRRRRRSSTNLFLMEA